LGRGGERVSRFIEQSPFESTRLRLAALSCQFHRCRRMLKIDTPLGGGGENAERGMGRPREHSKSRRQRPAPGGEPRTHRSAICHGTTRSARMSRLPGAVRRRSTATLIANGGFATTRKGRRGNRRSCPSAHTTVTSSLANLCRSSCARAGCNSNAMTRAPWLTKARVSTPVPAPISRTSSPAVTPASLTSRSAHWLSSRCHPHRVRGPDTADHREHCHAATIRHRHSAVGTEEVASRA
jgi:hypothetical protein